MKKFSVCILFLLSISPLFAQQDSVKGYTLGINQAGGFIISHSPTISYVANRHITATELYFEQNTFGNKEWHQRYSFLKIGLLFKHFQLNNKEHLGNTIVSAPYFKFHLKNSPRFNLGFRTSIGLAYLEKNFDVDQNHKNVAIGSNINMYLSLLLESAFMVKDGFYWTMGIGLDHISNTGFKTPNLGFNMPLISTGFSVDLGKKKKYILHSENPFKRENWYWQINYGIGFNENYPPNGKKYIANAMNITREKRISYKSSIAYGIDLFYNQANKAILEDSYGDISNSENIQVAASALHLLHFGKLIFSSQLSIYLKNKNKELGSIYHVFGGRYPVAPKVNAFFYGKTHIDRAEYIIMGFGYRIG